MFFTIVVGVIAGMVFRKQLAAVKQAADIEAKTADGRFPILNEDWIGETVLAIDDAEVPEVIRRHGASFATLHAMRLPWVMASICSMVATGICWTSVS